MAKKNQPEGVRQIARNRKAFHDFEVLEQIEAGMVLLGSEVKSLRQGSVSFNDSYARTRKGEVWLLDLHIAPYTNASWIDHEPRRERKLLLHKKQIQQLASSCDRQGLTLVPLELYFKKGKAKLMLGVCKGRKKHDKRQALRKRQDERAMDSYR